MVRAYNFHCVEEAIANKMNSEFQKGQQGKRNHKRIRRTFTQSYGGSTCSSDDFNKKKCMLEFAAVGKRYPGPVGAGVVLRDEDTSLVYYVREGLDSVSKGVAEYQASNLGLQYALERGYTHIRVEGDAKHVCMQ
ncbi:polynucleotidyl transferase, ribonuclease H-like superfamily protein, partial [Tanacetum coccineum]